MNTSNVWWKLAWSPFKPAAWGVDWTRKWSKNVVVVLADLEPLATPPLLAVRCYDPIEQLPPATSHLEPACTRIIILLVWLLCCHVTANLNCRRSSDCRTPFALNLFYVWTECHALACDCSNMRTDQSLITRAINLWIWYALHGIAYHSKWMCQQKACTKILICCCTSWHQCAVAEACGIIHMAWTNLLCRPKPTSALPRSIDILGVAQQHRHSWKCEFYKCKSETPWLASASCKKWQRNWL